jgi:CRP-like cAMP-binding protein
MVCLATEISNAYSLRSLACLNFHQVEARFCRWLLMARYHMNSDDLLLTQEFMAMMLGVQRSSVTVIAKKLQDQGVIAYHRGQISVLNVDALERSACECYAQMIAKIQTAFPRSN